MKTYKKLCCKNCRISNCPLQDIEVTDENKESDMFEFEKQIKKTKQEIIVTISKFNEKNEKIASAWFSDRHYEFPDNLNQLNCIDILKLCEQQKSGRVINHANRLLSTNGEISVYYFLDRTSGKNEQIGRFLSKDKMKEAILEHKKTVSPFGTYNIEINGYIQNFSTEHIVNYLNNL